jgi:hypothetical protein
VAGFQKAHRCSVVIAVSGTVLDHLLELSSAGICVRSGLGCGREAADQAVQFGIDVDSELAKLPLRLVANLLGEQACVPGQQNPHFRAGIEPLQLLETPQTV